MFPELRHRVTKAGQPPGTTIYTGEKSNGKPQITVISYNADKVQQKSGTNLAECLSDKIDHAKIWINVEGLQDPEIINDLANRYYIHALTAEDILNVGQRPKIEEFRTYIFITLKALFWHEQNKCFTSEQLSIAFGKNFILTFQESGTELFTTIKERLVDNLDKRLRENGPDYLAYRLLDTIVDQYFVMLENIGEQIEKIEERIISSPTPETSHTLYHLKRQMLSLRKAIWPVREAISHLLHANEDLIPRSTSVYLRDLYDHVAQAVDTIETFRDILAGMLDVYLSSLTIKMNEIMKVLTIIATIFIPITFIASVYGMNFAYMPELRWRYGYPAVLILMLMVTLGMLFYFKRKKWF